MDLLAQTKMETMVPPCSVLQEVWLLTSKLHLHDITVALAFTKSHVPMPIVARV